MNELVVNLTWMCDIGNGDEHLREVRAGDVVPARALYELTPDGQLLQRSPILYPAGTL